MLLLALLLQHGERQRERRDMRNMGDIGRMQVVLLRLHRHQRHSQRPVEALNGLDRIPVAAFAFADHGRPACEGSAAGGVGTAVLGTPHRVRGHEPSAAGVHGHHLAQFALDRTGVHHDLMRRDAVENLHRQQRNRIDGRSQHDQIGRGKPLFERHDPVDQPPFERPPGMFLRRLHPLDALRQPAVAQSQRKRSADQADAYNQHIHRLFLLRSRLQFHDIIVHHISAADVGYLRTHLAEPSPAIGADRPLVTAVDREPDRPCADLAAQSAQVFQHLPETSLPPRLMQEVDFAQEQPPVARQ